MSLKLSQLLCLLDEMPAYRRLLDELRRPGGGANAAALDAARPYIIAAIYRSLGQPVLVVTAHPENSKKLYEQLSAWTDSTVRLLAEPDILPYQRVVPDAYTEMERLQALSALAGVEPTAKAPLIIAPASAFMQKTTRYGDFVAASHTVEAGMEVEPFRLLSRWQAMGYRLEDIVEVPGTVSHRGGIVDVYPPTSELPVRLEFFGNAVESIRLFDPVSQRSQAAAASATIGPATEMLLTPSGNKADTESIIDSLDLSGCSAEAGQRFRQEITMLLDGQMPRYSRFYAPLFQNDSVLSYLSQGALLILDEPRSIESAMAELEAEADELRAEQAEQGELPGNFPAPYFTWRELEARISGRRCLALTSWDAADSQENRLNFAPAPVYAGQLPSFARKAKQLMGQNHRIIVTSHQASRLAEILGEEDIIVQPVAEIKQTPPRGSLTLVRGSLAEGWVMSGDTHLFSDAEIFGFAKQRRLMKKHPAPRHKLFAELKAGDYVVHVEHGIGKFAGVAKMRGNGSEKEYLMLLYAAGDRLYVPFDQIDRVDRYAGGGEKPPALSRLGTQEWARTKQKTRESAEGVARELLSIYAAREVVPGFAFSRDMVWQQELEASFPYVETPDQMEALEQVKEDMQKPKPMDRLVCGDVGYGKTEVAVRAAFKAVMDSRQVAVLVPTTVLAQQHFSTFSQRLRAFPVKVEVLSRFRTPKEQQSVLDGLADGTVDICIGTHRLLQKDVIFRDLGLLIIDEEQRFGVAHKEYLKKMRQEVDVLTLSATPIPRTLNMSLAGVRDMSTMETPPEERLPVKTYVAEYNDRLVRESILRELERDGQVFFVHNRVQSIDMVAGRLRALVPEAEISVGHGQMPEGELEKTMADFAEGRSDVLVCTTIIESGLDMPNANTIIVNHADRFGLTQLYQLRGRVGRGGELAHAYFLYERGKRLTSTAEKRLRTIFEATELGAGFSIAMRDLEIRGAGNLLGTKQSGFISAVGFSLYTRLLAEAVEELKARREGRKATKRPPPTAVSLPLRAYIPEDYVSDLGTRLEIYRRLAGLDAPGQTEALKREFGDRFGTPPPEVENLLYAIRIKIKAARAGIESISAEDGQIVLRLFEGMRFDRQKLDGDGIKVGNTQLRLNPKRFGKEWQKALEEVVGRVG